MNSTLEAESEQEKVRFYEVVDIGVGTKTYRITNAPHSVRYEGNDYVGFGQLLSFDELEENATLEIPKIGITISGIQDPSNTTINPAIDFLSLDYTHAPVEIARVYFNDAGFVGSVKLFEGYITGGSIAVNITDQCAVSLEVASHWGDFDREAGRYTNDKSQQRYFSGDVGFEYSVEVQKEVEFKA